MSKSITGSYFFHSILYQFKHKEFRDKIPLTLMLTFACFKEVGLVYNGVGKEPEPQQNNAATQS
jgi:hypothetical protein